MAHDNVYLRALREAGIEFDIAQRSSFLCLDEANQIRVADNVLGDMMKFITDKYNAIDFREIEKSAGDFSKFRYATMIMENTETLRNIYKSTPDQGALKYLEVIDAIGLVSEKLIAMKRSISELYRSGDGMVQIVYTSLVTSMISAIGILVANTIRFVTTEQTADCEVLFDEIPNTFKHVHIKNVLAAPKAMENFSTYMTMVTAARRNGSMNESISVAAITGVIKSIVGVFAPNVAAAAASTTSAGITAVTGVASSIAVPIIVIAALIYFSRDIIYAVYYGRTKISDYLAQQEAMVRTNIEALKRRGVSDKVIARQLKWANFLGSLSRKIGVKNDVAEANARAAKRKEDEDIKKKAGNEASQSADSGVML